MSIGVEDLAKLKAHRWNLSCLAFRDDGLELATAGWDKEVHIWDLSNLKVVSTLRGAHKVPITCLSWCPQGYLLCTGSADRTAVLWDTSTEANVGTLNQHSGWVLASSFSPSGSVLVTASWDKSICVWDISTMTLITTLTGHNKGVWSVDFNPYSFDVLCSSSEDGCLKIWDLRENRATHTLDSGHTDAIYTAKWSPDGTMIASGSADTKICVWDSNFSLLSTIYGHTDNVKSVAFNRNQDAVFPVLASAGDYRVILSDPRPTHKAEILSISPHSSGKEVEVVDISPDGSILASGGRDGLLVLKTLHIPSSQPMEADNSISSRLRSSGLVLDPEMLESVEDLTEDTSVSDLMASSGTTEDLFSLGQMPRDSPKGVAHHQIGSAAKKGIFQWNIEKKEHSARELREKRKEKKMVDLPTMIAHLSTSARGDLSSSSESSEGEDDDESAQHKIKLNAFIGVAEKVNSFSQFSRNAAHPEVGKKVSKPMLSLLPENAYEAVREKMDFFEYGKAVDDERDGLYDSDDSSQHHYTTGRYSTTKSPDSELGSGDEYDDDVQLSMI